jgi:hypothetical protein
MEGLLGILSKNRSGTLTLNEKRYNEFFVNSSRDDYERRLKLTN